MIAFAVRSLDGVARLYDEHGKLQFEMQHVDVNQLPKHFPGVQVIEMGCEPPMVEGVRKMNVEDEASKLALFAAGQAARDDDGIVFTRKEVEQLRRLVRPLPGYGNTVAGVLLESGVKKSEMTSEECSVFLAKLELETP